MLARKIPSSGEAIPVIGMGTWQTFDAGRDAQRQAALGDLLATFAAGGGALVDCSPMYGTAERVLGELIRGRGLADRLFVATKVWTSGERQGVAQMETSLRLLGKIDLMQVHNLVDTDVHLQTLAAWKREGRIRYVGVTHYAASAHAAVERALVRHPVDFVQINYSLAERDAEARLLPLARDKGVAVIVNRPFAEGALMRQLAKTALPSFAAELAYSTWGELALKFVVSHPAVTCVIPATANPAHLAANLRAGMGPLPDEAMRARIAAAIA